MIRDPEWFTKEADELLDRWYEEDTEMDYPEYLLKHASERTRQYYVDSVNYRNDGKTNLRLIFIG